MQKGRGIVREELVAWTLLTADGQASDMIKQEAESLFGASWDELYIHFQGQAKASDPSYRGPALYAIKASNTSTTQVVPRRVHDRPQHGFG